MFIQNRLGYYSKKIKVCSKLTSKGHGYTINTNQYQFTCSCGDVYIDRLDHRLSQQTPEHFLEWLYQLMLLNSLGDNFCCKKPSSFIEKHLPATCHIVDSFLSF